MPDSDANCSGPLIENVDYTVEAGRYVFTAAYLLRRGTCCGSGCRYCPYGSPSATETVDTRRPPPDNRSS
ncbi:MAG TPA: DUF5522 domain-containing protein [Tepidisphaeraceae bacterium]